MVEFFHKFHNLIQEAPLFWWSVLAGSGLFVIQSVLNLFGWGELAEEGSDWADATQFKWLSKHALTGFLLMFGWIGLACRNELHLSMLVSGALGLAGGCVTVLATGLLFKGANQLRSSGSVFRIEDAVGQQATVYQRIPERGIGKVTLSLHQFTHEIDAMADGSEEIPSFTPVHIIKTVDATTVVVTPIK